MVAWSVATLVGCGGDSVGASFRLHLTPRVLVDQDPFGEPLELRVGVDAPDAEPVWTLLGSTDEGELSAEGIGEVSDGSRVSLAFQTPGGSGDNIDPARLAAWGDAVILGPVSGDVEVSATVANQADVGELDRLSANGARWYAAAAIAGSDAFVFGGTTYPVGPDAPSTDEILHLLDLDGGDWSLTPTEVKLPPYADGLRERCGATATTVEGRDGPLVLVTGGRAVYGQRGGSGDIFQAFVWDPVALDVVWKGDMSAARSEHRAVLMDDGRVLIVGSESTGSEPVTAELFDPIAFELIPVDGSLAVGPYGFDAVSLGSDGVLVCGGAASSGVNYVPTDSCSRITLAGKLVDEDPLPVATARHALSSLPDGAVLLTGGIIDASASQVLVSAVAQAWKRTNGGAWNEVGGLEGPRAHHRAIGLADGRVVLIGGAETGGAVWPDPTVGVRCAEVYDPERETFSRVDKTCSDAGAGADPAVSDVVFGAAFVFSGYAIDTVDTVGGRSYGLVGAGP